MKISFHSKNDLTWDALLSSMVPLTSEYYHQPDSVIQKATQLSDSAITVHFNKRLIAFHFFNPNGHIGDKTSGYIGLTVVDKNHKGKKIAETLFSLGMKNHKHPKKLEVTFWAVTAETSAPYIFKKSCKIHTPHESALYMEQLCKANGWAYHSDEPHIIRGLSSTRRLSSPSPLAPSEVYGLDAYAHDHAQVRESEGDRLFLIGRLKPSTFKANLTL